MIKNTIIGVFAIFTTSAYAQETAFRERQINIQAGVSFVPTLSTVYYGSPYIGHTEKWGATPITLTADVAVSDYLSTGIYVGIAKVKFYNEFGENYGNNRYTIIGLRGLYHRSANSKIEGYAGSMVGLAANKIHLDYTGVNGGSANTFKESQFVFQLILGGRYYVSDNAGVYAELGYGVCVFNLGLNLKF